MNESPQHDIHDEGDLRDPYVTVDRDGNDALVWGDLDSDASVRGGQEVTPTLG